MTSPNSRIRCVGAVVHDHVGRLLLIRRAHEPAAGRWSIPGGKVEPGEADSIAITRELREETGLDCEPCTYLGTVIRGPYDIHDYTCRVTGGALHAGDDASDARWVGRDEYRKMEEDGLLVDDLTATLRSWNALPHA